MQALNTSGDAPFYEMTVPLDGTDYLLSFRYSSREACWYFSIALNDGTLLAAGVKIVCNRSLLGRFADVRLPPGMLIATTGTNDASLPGLDELGIDRRVTLVYIPKAEAAAAKAANG